MRILYITSSWFLDGDFPLIRELINKGVDVHLYIKVYTHSLTSTLLDLKAPYKKTGIFDSSIYGNAINQFKKYIGIEKIYVINHTHSDNSIINLSITKIELEHIKKIDPDIIHFIGWPSLYEIPIILRYGKKIITTIHDPIPHLVTLKTKINRIVRKLFCRSIGHYILLNKKQTNEFVSLYGIDKYKLHYSKLGNFDVLRMFTSKSEEGKRTLLFFGRISPYKGINYLLEAYYSIMDHYPDTKLIIAGGGEYNFDITKYLNNSQIEFINEYLSIDKLSELIQRSDFVVCPYISATQSGVVASAYSLNKPVIATRVGGISEMVIDGETGLLIEPRDIAELKKSIRFLLDNPDKVSQMSKTIEYLSNFGPHSWASIASDYINYYSYVSLNG